MILPPADAVMALLVETMRGMYTIIDTAYNSRQQSEFGGGGVSTVKTLSLYHLLRNCSSRISFKKQINLADEISYKESKTICG